MTLACVVLAHTDPQHVRRLIAALDPFPVFLHCDKRTPAGVYAEMTGGLPARVTVMPRLGTGWARWENVAAELAGYRLALETEATHVALMTGSDYPLASTATITKAMTRRPGFSFAHFERLPRSGWGRSGGIARLRYPHVPWRKHMFRIPVPRRLPQDVVLAGGSQVKVLSRQHVQRVVEAVDARPDLVAFWRRSWIPDESFVGSILNTPALAPDWAGQHSDSDLWFIGWGSTPQKSPQWLRLQDLPRLEAARADGCLFARKFGSAVDRDIVDRVDERLRV